MKKYLALVLSVCFVLVCLFSVNFEVIADNTNFDSDLDTWGNDLTGDNWAQQWADYFENPDKGDTFNNAYEINSAQELAVFAKLVREGHDFHNKFVRLTADLDIGEKQWAPIGINIFSGATEPSEQYPFLGTFDAGIYQNGVLTGNHKIKNLKISYLNPTNYGHARGLFATVGSSNTYNCKATVQNLDIVGVDMDLSNNPMKRVGAVAGLCSGVLKNCNVYKNGDSIINNENFSDKNNITGGVVGYLRSGSLHQCFNEVTVKSLGWCGGIAGRIAAESGTSELPTENRERLIFNCKNKGAITGRVVGGIGGYLGAGASGTCNIVQCKNTGNITAYRLDRTEINSCAGGIAGFTSDKMQFIACANEGKITTHSNTEDVQNFEISMGGIIGKGNAVVVGCYNSSNDIGTGITGKAYSGGLVGCALSIGNPVWEGHLYLSYYLKNGEDLINSVGNSNHNFPYIDKIFKSKTSEQFIGGESEFSDSESYDEYESQSWPYMTFNKKYCWRFWDGKKPIIIYENTEFISELPDSSNYNGNAIIPELKMVMSDGSVLSDLEDLENLQITYYKLNNGNYIKLIDLPNNVGQYKVVCYYATATDYGLHEFNFQILKRNVSITPLPLSKTYGEQDPKLEYDIENAEAGSNTGMIENDLNLLQGKLSREKGEDVKLYEYNLGDLSAGENYNLVLNVGSDEHKIKFAIQQRDAVLNIKNITSIYGDKPNILYELSNIINDDQVILLNAQYQIKYKGIQVFKYKVGNEYEIYLSYGDLGGDDAKNYKLQLNADSKGYLTVTPSELIITADNASKIYGESIINYSSTISGWKYNDGLNKDEILADFQYQCEGESDTAPCYENDEAINYKIHVTADCLSQNYTLKFIDGSLTITEREIRISNIQAKNKIFDGLSIAEINAEFSNILDKDKNYIENYFMANYRAFYETNQVGENIKITVEFLKPAKNEVFYNYYIGNGENLVIEIYGDITKCPLTIKIKSEKIEYGSEINELEYIFDGAPLNDTNNLENLLSDNFNISADFNNGNIGTYPIIFKGKDNQIIGDDYFESVFTNYKAGDEGWFVESFVEITKRKLIINQNAFTFNEKIYDGTDNVNYEVSEDLIIWNGYVPEIDRFTPEIIAKYNSCDVGSDKITIKFIIPDERNLNEKYEIEDLILEISPIKKKTINVIFEQTKYEIEYGQKIPQINFDINGCVTTEFASVKSIMNECLRYDFNENSNAGNYPIYFDKAYIELLPNYDVELANIYLIINPVILPKLDFPSKEFTYDGKYHYPVAFIGEETIEDFINKNQNIEIEYNFIDLYGNQYKDAGVYNIKLEFELTGDSKLNYVFESAKRKKDKIESDILLTDFAKIATYTINKKDLYLTADDLSMIRGGELPDFTYSFDGFIKGENENNTQITGLRNIKINTNASSKSDVGNYTISINGVVTAQNYDIKLKNGTLTIIADSDIKPINGVIVYGLANGAKFNAERLSVKNPKLKDAINQANQINTNQTTVAVYQIKFEKDENDYISPHNVVVKVKIPDNYKDQKILQLMKVSEDNNVEWVETSLVGDYLQFSSKSGGTFLLLANVAESDAFNMNIIYITVPICVVVILLIVFLISRKKRRAKMQNIDVDNGVDDDVDAD